MDRQRRKLAALLGVAIIAAGVGLIASATHALRRSEQQATDARFSIRGRRAAPSDVVLVLVDNATLQEMGRRGLRSEFPFPRRYDARVIDQLRRAGARAIALDLEFTHETDPTDDNALIEALGRAHGRTVLAATEVAPGGRTDVLGGPEVVGSVGARTAEARLTLDSDGVVRRLAYSYNGLVAFPVATAEVSSGRPVERSLFGGGTVPIDFIGPPGSVRSISYYKVLLGQFRPGEFRGRTVIVGASDPVLGDVHTTATSSSATMPGPEVVANETDTLLRGVPLRNAPGWVDVLLIVLLGLAPPLSALSIRKWRALADALVLGALFAVANQLTFDNGWIVDFVYPMLTLVVATLGALAVLYFIEALERERVRSIFSRFVPGSVVEEVLASTDENLRLAGVERDCTVLFSDLRGFTSFSETQPAARVIEVVNTYLNEMTEAILDAGGTLISYMGDGIMALFGAPLEQDDHADRALTAAREMVGPRLRRFNAWLAGQGFEHGFAMGVGLNSGLVMAGSVGSEQRVEYTAIGDTTNTAARLEGMTKGSGTMVFIADSTRERIRRPVADLSLVGEFEVRGRTAKLAVWTIDSARIEAKPVTELGPEPQAAAPR